MSAYRRLWQNQTVRVLNRFIMASAIETPTASFERTDIWREGKYADLWSVVHVLSGTHFGFLPLLLTAGLAPLAVVTVLLLVLWEVVEKFVLGVTEHPANQTTDVLFGMVGFSAAYPAAMYLSSSAAWSLVVITSLLNFGLSVWGWRVSVRAEAVKKKLREDYERERLRLKEIREDIVEEFRDARRLPKEWNARRKERRAARRKKVRDSK